MRRGLLAVAALAALVSAHAAEPAGLVFGIGMQGKGPAGNYTSTNPALYGHLSPLPGTPNAPTSGAHGGYGQAVNLDATKQQYLDTSCRPDLYNGAGTCTADNGPARASQSVNRWTVAAWVFVKPTAVPDVRWAVAEKAGAYFLALDSATRRVQAGAVGKQVTSSAAVPLNKWTHVAATYNGARITVYVDCVAKGSVAATGATAVNYQPLTLGVRNVRGATPTWDSWFAGAIDDFRLYNRALSKAEVCQAKDSPLL